LKLNPLNKVTALSRRQGIAIALIGVVGIVTAVAITVVGQPSADRVVVAEFADASPLLVGNDVQVDGVKVGSVTGMSVVNGHADVSFTVSPKALPLHTDAQVEIRPVSLLGERYLALNPGTPSAPVLRAGQVIPLSHTGQNTDLYQVLNVFNQPTGDALAALVTVLGQGLQGNGANMAATIKALAPAMTDTDGLVRILDQQNSTLNSLVDNVEPVAQALAHDNGQTMNALVESTDRLLGTTAAHQQALEAVLTQLPSTLTSAQQTLADLAGTANAAVPTLAGVRPTVDNLNAISQEIDQFSTAANPALAHAQPVLVKAQALLDAARPVAGQLLQAGPPLQSDAGSLAPLVTKLSGNINNVMNFIRGWALSTNGSDGLSHYFRALVIVTPKMLTGLLPGGGPNLSAGPAASAPSASAPKPPVSGGPLSGILPTSPLSGILPASPGPGGGVTGLTPQQEGGALQFLLGG
jgi:phospholipid/cholesterol/gamma-HCH transport system substrate-binding protein